MPPLAHFPGRNQYAPSDRMKINKDFTQVKGRWGDDSGPRLWSALASEVMAPMAIPFDVT